MLIMRARTPNNNASTCVALIKKSDVRRTPNIIPTFPPPNVPASPPPLLDCIKIAIINNILIITSTAIKKPNIHSPTRFSLEIVGLKYGNVECESRRNPLSLFQKLYPHSLSFSAESALVTFSPEFTVINRSIYFPIKSNSKFTLLPALSDLNVVFTNV